MSPREKLIRALRERIETGQFKPNESLPTEYQLMELYGISRGTVRSALKALEDEGLITGKKFAGKVVASTNSAPSLLESTFILLSAFQRNANIGHASGLLRAVDSGILDGANAQNLHGLIVQSNPIDSRYLKRMVDQAPCGLLVTDQSIYDEELLPILLHAEKRSLPIISNGPIASLNNVDVVDFDHYTGMKLLLEYLTQRGITEITRCWSCPADFPWIQERNRAYDELAKPLKLSSRPPIYVENLPDRGTSRSDFDRRVRHYAGYLIEPLSGPNPAQAILATSDVDVAPIAAACRLFGKTPGKDVIVIGYDNNFNEITGERFENYRPPVSIDKRNFEVGLAMVDQLQKRIQLGVQDKGVVIKHAPMLVNL